MYAMDFEYDNHYLSDYGFIICNFDSKSGADTIDAGSKITFNTVSQNKGVRYSLIGTKYDECITATFDICKNPDMYNDLEITNDEYIEIVRWLNRKKFLKLHFVDDEHEINPCYFEASFNISKIKIGEKLYGIKLEMSTNKPFGYGEEINVVWGCNSNAIPFPTSFSQSLVINDTSDEIGYIYPNIKITCKRNGELHISNNLTGSLMIIKNCVSDEVININGSTYRITTTNQNHDIYNDFNYDFLKIGNTVNERKNIISVNLPCELEITYSPIIKNSPN